MIIISGKWSSHHLKPALILKRHPLIDKQHLNALSALMHYPEIDTAPHERTPQTLKVLVSKKDKSLTHQINQWIKDSQFPSAHVQHCHLIHPDAPPAQVMPETQIFESIESWLSTCPPIHPTTQITKRAALSWLRSHGLTAYQAQAVLERCSKPLYFQDIIQTLSLSHSTTIPRINSSVLTRTHDLHHYQWESKKLDVYQYSSIYNDPTHGICANFDMSYMQQYLSQPLSATHIAPYHKPSLETIAASQSAHLPLCQGVITDLHLISSTHVSVPFKRSLQPGDCVLIVGSHVHRQYPQHRATDQYIEAQSIDFLSEAVRMCQTFISQHPLGISGLLSHQHGSLVERLSEWVELTGYGLELSSHPDGASFHEPDWSINPTAPNEHQLILMMPQQSLASWLLICDQHQCPVAVIGRVTARASLTLDQHPLTSAKHPAPCLPAIKKITERKGRAIKSPPFKTQQSWLKKVLSHSEVANKNQFIYHTDITGYASLIQGPACQPSLLPINNYCLLRQQPSLYHLSSHGYASCPHLSTNAIAYAWTQALTNLAGTVHSRDITSMQAVITRPKNKSSFDSTLRRYVGRLARALGVALTCEIHDMSTFSVTVTSSTFVASPPKINPTPQRPGDYVLWIPLVTLKGLGHTVISQIHTPYKRDFHNLPHTTYLKSFLNTIHRANQRGLIHSLHDISRGGCLVSLLEKCMAGGLGMHIDIPIDIPDAHFLWHEGPGILITTDPDTYDQTANLFRKGQLTPYLIGYTTASQTLSVKQDNQLLWQISVAESYSSWTHGLEHPYHGTLQWPVSQPPLQITRTHSDKPLRVLILTDRGTYGDKLVAEHLLDHGLCPVQFSVNELIRGHQRVSDFQAIIIPGGATHDDAKEPGWFTAQKIIQCAPLAQELSEWFKADDTLMLGFGNGAQIISHLHPLHSDQKPWPKFRANASQSYEARPIRLKVNTRASELMKHIAHWSVTASIKGSFLQCDLTEALSPFALSHDDAPWISEKDSCLGFWSENGRVGAWLIQPDDVQYSADMLAIYDALREWLIAHHRSPKKF